MAFWNNLWPFGIIYGHLVYFCIFGQEKSGNPDEYTYVCALQHECHIFP
jgi:hypothetical protein